MQYKNEDTTFASKKIQTSESIDLLIFSEKITCLIRQISDREFDAVNILSKKEAEFLTCESQTKINFSDINDLLEKIICKLAEREIKKI